MLKVPAVLASFAAVLLVTGCSSNQGDPSAASTVSPLAPSSVAQKPPTTPPPSGSSFKNCRGGKNIHWWVAHIEDVTAADLEALAALSLKNADASDFDPSDTGTLAAWLKEGARSDDIFYALSAQLAVGVLNVRHEFVHESATFVLVDQASRELARENPSIGFMETLLFEFNRCQ